MRLFRLILYALIAFFFFRLVRIAMRMVANRKREAQDDADAFTPPRRPVRNAPDLRNIKDAEFEDLTPPEKSTHSPNDTSQ